MMITLGMNYGFAADHLVGAMSRLLHFRGAKHNTLKDLERYYGLTADEMFPEPLPVRDARTKRTLFDRVIKSRTVSWTSTHEVLCPTYRQRHLGAYKRNLTAHLRWVRPDGRQRDSVLIYVHGWLEPGSWAEEAALFPKWGRELEVDLAHVALPFHGPRKPRSALFSGEFFWTADMVRSAEAVRQAVHDVRASVAWLRGQGYAQVGVTGLSLGGAVTMLTACVDPTPDYIAPIVAHLQLADAVETAPILWRVKKDLKDWGYDEPARREIMTNLGWPDYRPRLAPERQLWVQARSDVYMDPKLVERQWSDWGEPPILWIDGGHMTFAMHMSAITDRINSFRRQLD